MIGIVTDSNSQISAEWARRYGIEVVALTVVIDGAEYAEGVDLDADGFYARFAGRARPTVATSQPSPGRFADAYKRAAARGADEILSVHLGSAISGTLNSARVAATAADVPVRLVDTGTSSFGVSYCVRAAAEAVAAGAGIDEAALRAERLGALVGNVFTVGALDLARAGGRIVVDATGAGTPVLSLDGGEVRTVAHARDLETAAEVMADYCTRPELGARVRVAVGVADIGAAPLRLALEDRLSRHPAVDELLRYRIGPSVGAHTGPGTAGAYFHPVS
ncbi:MAG: DegV family protein [Acidimicrobiia bacterium]